MKTQVQIQVPGGAQKVLLHACCAPCSSAIVECLIERGIRPVIFYANSNIFPREEYDHRLNECLRYAKKWGIEIVDDIYDHSAWRQCATGLEAEPEGGKRCTECFRLRLLETAKLARHYGFDYFCTTLTLSRYKDAVRINALGEEIGAMLGVSWLPSDFKKQGREVRSSQLARQYGLYQQLYCGCEYSLHSREEYEARQAEKTE